MLCPLPAITDLVPKKRSNDHIMAEVWFEMDGILSVRQLARTNPAIATFTYLPDPEFYKFTDGDDDVKFYKIDQEYLVLKVRSFYYT